jgi:hypothetical protein
MKKIRCIKMVFGLCLVVLFFVPCIGQAQPLEFGDAPEGALAYPSLGVFGSFPTCLTVGPLTWIQHTNFGAWFGPSFDFEGDGNAGLCPVFGPYDADECFVDGDAGLLFPQAYTIDPTPAVVPCPLGQAQPALGLTCQIAVWGVNIDIDVVNFMPNFTEGFVNVLVDWNQDGFWGGSALCPDGSSAPEHVLVNFFPVPNGFAGPLSILGPPSFLIGPNPGYVWARITITEQPVPLPWDGSGSFEDGESEDYLILVDPDDVPTVFPVIDTECPVIETECPVLETECPTSATKCPVVETECPVIQTECPVLETECPTVATRCPVIPTECPVIETECPTGPTFCPVVPTECPAVVTHCPGDPTFCPIIDTQCPADPVRTVCPEEETACPVVETECPTLATECPSGIPTWCPIDPTFCPKDPPVCPPEEFTIWPEVQTQCPVIFTVCPDAPTLCPPLPTECPNEPITWCPEIPTECPIDPIFTFCPLNETQCPDDPTNCPIDWTLCPDIPTVCPDVQTVCPEAITTCPATPTLCETPVPTVCPTDPTNCPALPTECPVDPTNCPTGPTLCGIVDTDSDGIDDCNDNCPNHPNGPSGGSCTSGNVGDPCLSNGDCGTGGICSLAQEDTYPPGGNGCGDACECEGNFDDDPDQDGSDAATFKVDFGRSIFLSPCITSDPCNGDFDCDGDVDGTDAAKFKEDFGRSPFLNPCPICPTDPWCIYP